MEVLLSFLRRHFAVKLEVVSQNVGCFLRLDTQVLFMRGFRFRSKPCSWLPPKGRRCVDRRPTPKHLRRTQSKPLLPRVQAWTQHLSALGLTIGNPVNLVSAPFKELITCGAKLRNADWLRQRAFFLKIKRANFGNQEGIITWCWLNISCLATKRYCRWNFFATMASRFVETDEDFIEKLKHGSE